MLDLNSLSVLNLIAIVINKYLSKKDRKVHVFDKNIYIFLIYILVDNLSQICAIEKKTFKLK